MTHTTYFRRKVNPARKDSKHWDEGVIISNLPLDDYPPTEFPEDKDDYGPEHYEGEENDHE